MGFGLPASIGAAIATGRRVVCVEGDGSFVMNSYELETIRRLGLPIKMFVVRNGGYASIRRSQKRAKYEKCVPTVPQDLQAIEQAFMGFRRWRHTIDRADQVARTLNDDDNSVVIQVEMNCELSHRMSTTPPGKPEEMLPRNEEAEQETKRWRK
jgi:thiamine pyrophosphate-dependent acetolactate synthase large subunit-like protein